MWITCRHEFRLWEHLWKFEWIKQQLLHYFSFWRCERLNFQPGLNRCRWTECKSVHRWSTWSTRWEWDLLHNMHTLAWRSCWRCHWCHQQGKLISLCEHFYSVYRLKASVNCCQLLSGSARFVVLIKNWRQWAKSSRTNRSFGCFVNDSLDLEIWSGFSDRV